MLNKKYLVYIGASYGVGMDLVWRWYGDGMDFVLTWYGLNPI